jgi:hypothetical protein
MVVVGPDGQVKLSTVLTYKVDKYLKELTTGAWTPKNNGERITIDGDHGKLVAYLQKPELSQGQKCPMVIIDGSCRRIARRCHTRQHHGETI